MLADRTVASPRGASGVFIEMLKGGRVYIFYVMPDILLSSYDYCSLLVNLSLSIFKGRGGAIVRGHFPGKCIV